MSNEPLELGSVHGLSARLQANMTRKSTSRIPVEPNEASSDTARL
jgi:hypothetical protein